MCGICRPYRGKVRVDGQDTAKCRDLFHGKLAMLPQDPQCLFVKKTVREDLEEMLPASCLDKRPAHCGYGRGSATLRRF